MTFSVSPLLSYYSSPDRQWRYWFQIWAAYSEQRGEKPVDNSPNRCSGPFLKMGDTLASFQLAYTVWWSMLYLKGLVRCGLDAWLADFNSFGEMPSGPVDFICLICRRTLSSVNFISESDGTPLDCSSESEDNNGMIEGGSSRANFSPTEAK